MLIFSHNQNRDNRGGDSGVIIDSGGNLEYHGDGDVPNGGQRWHDRDVHSHAE